MKIEKLYTYPVKALRAVELDSVQVTKHGFPHDRRFMILKISRNADGSIKNENVHVAHFPQSVRFFPKLDLEGELVSVTYKPVNGGEEKTIEFPLYPFTDDLDVIDVEMHRSPTTAYKMPQQYSDWFSSCYGFEVVLAYIGRNYRAVLMSTSHNKQPSPTQNSGGWLSSLTNTIMGSNTSPNAKHPNLITFSDCAPYLIASSHSMDDLHPRFPANTPMDIQKFRPNIIVAGAETPWSEDYWGEITIASTTTQVQIECVHNCGRCKSINIDYDQGTPGKGPEGTLLKQMQRDRRVDRGAKYSPIMGRYSFLKNGEGEEIKVGDEVTVSKVLEEGTTFGEFESPFFCSSLFCLVLVMIRDCVSSNGYNLILIQNRQNRLGGFGDVVVTRRSEHVRYM